MNARNFLSNELLNGNMNDSTLITVSFRKKKYLCTMSDCEKFFGGLLVKSCKKRKEFNGQEMKNSFDLVLI